MDVATSCIGGGGHPHPLSPMADILPTDLGDGSLAHSFLSADRSAYPSFASAPADLSHSSGSGPSHQYDTFSYGLPNIGGGLGSLMNSPALGVLGPLGGAPSSPALQGPMQLPNLPEVATGDSGSFSFDMDFLGEQVPAAGIDADGSAGNMSTGVSAHAPTDNFFLPQAQEQDLLSHQLLPELGGDTLSSSAAGPTSGNRQIPQQFSYHDQQQQYQQQQQQQQQQRQSPHDGQSSLPAPGQASSKPTNKPMQKAQSKVAQRPKPHPKPPQSKQPDSASQVPSPQGPAQEPRAFGHHYGLGSTGPLGIGQPQPQPQQQQQQQQQQQNPPDQLYSDESMADGDLMSAGSAPSSASLPDPEAISSQTHGFLESFSLSVLPNTPKERPMDRAPARGPGHAQGPAPLAPSRGPIPPPTLAALEGAPSQQSGPSLARSPAEQHPTAGSTPAMAPVKNAHHPVSVKAVPPVMAPLVFTSPPDGSQLPTPAPVAEAAARSAPTAAPASTPAPAKGGHAGGTGAPGADSGAAAEAAAPTAEQDLDTVKSNSSEVIYIPKVDPLLDALDQCFRSQPQDMEQIVYSARSTITSSLQPSESPPPGAGTGGSGGGSAAGSTATSTATSSGIGGKRPATGMLSGPIPPASVTLHVPPGPSVPPEIADAMAAAVSQQEALFMAAGGSLPLEASSMGGLTGGPSAAGPGLFDHLSQSLPKRRASFGDLSSIPGGAGGPGGSVPGGSLFRRNLGLGDLHHQLLLLHHHNPGIGLTLPGMMANMGTSSPGAAAAAYAAQFAAVAAAAGGVAGYLPVPPTISPASMAGAGLLGGSFSEGNLPLVVGAAGAATVAAAAGAVTADAWPPAARRNSIHHPVSASGGGAGGERSRSTLALDDNSGH
ncbi:hypothetical protein H696_02404 [Fonticula alba]|uniref:Uncharacterized protein n=1 Tax=Fonticula alba TaxID=691883 RepID=A0A058ZC11_FONAL|nr:hypothetical protein H696_02404 [Fonticula alba]KCV71458.1 hypothetical protein H696_02404 [Fonticula alba]|eukprot:XP_009494581.1 hypothetical protein H696_02404 [Fonticula alba]